VLAMATSPLARRPCGVTFLPSRTSSPVTCRASPSRVAYRSYERGATGGTSLLNRGIVSVEYGPHGDLAVPEPGGHQVLFDLARHIQEAGLRVGSVVHRVTLVVNRPVVLINSRTRISAPCSQNCTSLSCKQAVCDGRCTPIIWQQMARVQLDGVRSRCVHLVHEVLVSSCKLLYTVPA
jgi:hypothetical protein